jgi:hypothetical protein
MRFLGSDALTLGWKRGSWKVKSETSERQLT